MSDVFFSCIVFWELSCLVGVMNKHSHFKNKNKKPTGLVSGERGGTCN